MNSSKSDYLSLLLDLPAEKHSSLGSGRCWFSLTCCFPKDDVTTVTTQQHERQTNYSILKDVVADQDETERTTLEEDDDNEEMGMIFLDASSDEPPPLLQSSSNSSSSSSQSNSNSTNKPPVVINSVVQEIFQTLLGFFMINYFLDVFRHNQPQQQQPQRICSETPVADAGNKVDGAVASMGTPNDTTQELA